MDSNQPEVGLEDMLCTLYSELQATRHALNGVQQEMGKLVAVSQKTAQGIVALSNDVLALRLQIQSVSSAPVPVASPMQRAPEAEHETDNSIWDKRPNEDNPESIFSMSKIKIPNR